MREKNIIFTQERDGYLAQRNAVRYYIWIGTPAEVKQTNHQRNRVFMSKRHKANINKTVQWHQCIPNKI